VGGTVDVFGLFESQIQQRSDFLSGMVAEPTDQPDMLDQESGTPLGAHQKNFDQSIIAANAVIVYGC